ncbi:phage head-tail adaptor, putative, SPP1 family [Onishia taeanensis]|uniref:Phage head-tail adaptor, putative, SPP1 family n=1 Tax=Onishia taeanensis TaxID=284577 RepID=A0A1G7N6R8_9GAMM|nr:phage head closure protein [Halomonas taeanensis]SDF69755.1 phage head-tail adaptor, putative, SPP1 family [Halomonas taeanensis]
MQTGKLRHRVTIERPMRTQDPTTGEMVSGWSAVATVWASIDPLSAREFIAAQAGQSEISARIIIRHREGLDASMRVVQGTRIYNIQGVLADPKSGRHYITLPVSEGVTDGI